MKYIYKFRSVLLLLVILLTGNLALGQCTSPPNGCMGCVVDNSVTAINLDGPENCGNNDGQLGIFNFLTNANPNYNNYPLTVEWYSTTGCKPVGLQVTTSISAAFPTSADLAPQLTGLTAGETYTIAVYEAGGTAYWTETRTVGANGLAPDSATMVPNNSQYCAGGSVTLNANEVLATGQPWDAATSFIWYNGTTAVSAQTTGLTSFVVNSPGDYTVEVFNGSCSKTSDVITVSEMSLSLTVAETTPVSCFGSNDGEATATASGGTTYDYLWSTTQLDGNVVASTGLNLSAGTTYTVTATESTVGCSVTGSVTLTPVPSAITPTLSVLQHETCVGSSDGIAQATAASGSGGPYNFTWSTGFVENGVMTSTVNGLTTGAFSVTIDEGTVCITVSSDNITVSPSITINESSTDETCGGYNDGTASTAPVGGNGSPYSYLWSPGAEITQNITGLAPGIYSITVNNSGAPASCGQNASITITAAPLITVSNVITEVSCAAASNGAIDITAGGGTGALTYQWSANAGGGAGAINGTNEDLTNLACGATYTITITDINNCTVSNASNLTCTPNITVSTTFTSPSCPGVDDATATAVVTGGTAPYSYLWDDGQATATATGLSGSETGIIHSVTVEPGSICSVTGSANITVSPVITVTTTVTPETCPGSCDGTAVANTLGGVGPFNYIWSNTDVGASTTGLCNGSFTVTSTDTFTGCYDTDVVNVTTSPSVTVTSTITNPSCSAADGDIDITAAGGQTPYTFNWSTGANSEDINGLDCTGNPYLVTVTPNGNAACAVTATNTLVCPTAVTITLDNQKNPTCALGNDGSISITATGGNGTYSYSWDNGATTDDINGLTSGTYNITVSSAGCTATNAYTLTDPIAVTATAVVDNDVLCNGSSDGQATVSGLGGTSPYIFDWFTIGQNTATATGLTAGVYPVSVTDNLGCIGVDQITITEPTALTVTASVDNDPTCNSGSDGQATAVGMGGTVLVDYTFSWNTTPAQNTATANNLTAGVYSVTVSDDNNCSDIATVTIVDPIAITATASVDNNPLCNGSSDGQATVVGIGGSVAVDYTYSWNTVPAQNTATANNLTAGVYSVTVFDDNMCQGTDQVTLTPPNAVTATASVDNNVLCNGESTGQATVIGTGGTIIVDYIYTWNTIPAQNTATATALSAGVYSVTVEDDNGCTDTDQITITEPTAVTATASVDNNVSCNGGSDGQATAVGSGGTAAGAYQFSWNSTPVQNTATANNLPAGVYDVTVTDDNLCTAIDQITITEPAAITVSTTVTHVTCAGESTGEVGTIVVGGSGPYSYSWSGGNAGGQTSPSAVNLIDGTYTVTVTDANLCTQTATDMVTVSNPILTTVTSTDVLCAGDVNGTGSITVSGGTAPYAYNWNGAGLSPASANNSGLSANTYVVTVTDFVGCAVTTTVTINDQLALTVTNVITNVDCNGGTTGAIDLTVIGGNTAYTYSWSTSDVSQDVSGLSAGTYDYTVTDANMCTDIATLTISENTAITITAISNDATCGVTPCDGSISVTSVTGGGTSYSYLWSDGVLTYTTAAVTGICANTYDITATDNLGCVGTNSVNVIQPGVDAVTITNVIHESCIGAADGSITVTNSTIDPPITLQWLDAFNNPIPGETTNVITGLSGGTYSISLTNASGCTDVETQVVNDGLDIVVTEVTTNVACFGDATGAINITPAGGTSYTYDWDNDGVGDNNDSEDLNLLSQGVYNLIVTATDGIVACSESFSYTVTQPATAVDASNTNFSDATCNGFTDGTASVLPPYGGTAGTGYSYNWSNGGSTAAINSLAAGTYTVTVMDGNGCTDVSPIITVSEPTAITVTTVTSDYNGYQVSCPGSNDGSITVTSAGGNLPHTYQWGVNAGSSTSNIVTGLVAGTYTVTVTAPFSTCAEVRNFTLTEPTSITVTSTITDPLCNGDANGEAAAIGVGGASTNYTYQWDVMAGSQMTQVATGLIAGNYVVTVMDVNSCEGTTTVTLVDNGVLTASTTVTTNYNGEDIDCNGNSNANISVTASGGVTNYSYQWDANAGNAITAGVTGLGAGSYDVTITDANNCTVTDNVIISEPSAITLTTSVTDASCNVSNGSITVTAIGGTVAADYSYSWSTSDITATVTGLPAAGYSVTVTDDNNCSVSIADAVNNIGAESLTVTNTTVSCFNDCDATLFANTPCVTGPCTFDWTGGQNQQTVTGLCSGAYFVTVTNSLGCKTIEPATVFNADSIGAGETITHINCFGANSGEIQTNAFGGNATTYSYVWNGGTATGSTTSTVSGLSAGTYDLTISDNSGFNCTESYAFDVTVTPALTITSSVVTTVTCNGDLDGAINITVSQGTSPYSYMWSSSDNTEDVSGLGAGVYTVTVTDNSLCNFVESYTITEPPVLTITNTVSTSVSCFGGNDGTAAITVTGGDGNYGFSWSASGSTTASASGLLAGVVSVTVLDGNACSATENITIIEPAASVTVTTTVSDVTCNGGNNGSATAIAGGGTTPYSYLWTTAGNNTTGTVSGLFAVSETVTVTDASGCNAIANATISQPSVIAINFITQPTPCTLTDGGITITPSGGTGTTYTYLWSNIETTQSITGLGVGLYDVTVFDANMCSQVETDIVVSATDGPSITVTNVTSPSCEGYDDGSIDISVSGGTAPYTYLWNPLPVTSSQTAEDAIGVEAGVYRVLVFDQPGCLAFEDVTVSEPQGLVSAFSSTDPTCGQCDGVLSVTVTGGTSPYNYLWNNNAITQQNTGLCAGIYEVSVTDDNGCSSTFNTGISNVGGPTAYTLTTTNPSCFGAGNASASITSISGGATPYTYLWYPDAGQTSATATGLDVGDYTVEITDGNNCKLVIDTTIQEPFEIIDSIAAFPTTCGGSDGSLNVYLSGGQTPYFYNWSNGATTSSLNGLSEGGLLLTVTDNAGCQEDFTYFINGSTAANVTATSVGTNISCNGQSDGRAIAGANGGSSPYTFIWLDEQLNPIGQSGVSAINLSIGTYIVSVVDNAGCVSFADVEITEPTEIIFGSSVVNDVTCFGESSGSGNILAIGGTYPYSYQWNNGSTVSSVSNVPAGTYTITVTDNKGCQKTNSIVIDEPTELMVDTVTGNNVICSAGTDGLFDVEVSGGSSPYTYLWSNGATDQDISGLAPNSYTVTVTDANSCTKEVSFTVGGTQLSAVTTPVSCIGSEDGTADLTVTGANTPFTYLWNPPPGVGSQSSEDVAGLATGVYAVTVEDALGCTSSLQVTVNNATPISVSFTAVESTCGDCNGELTANVSGGAGGFSYLWSNNGSNQTESGLCAGVYEVSISDANGCAETYITGLSNIGGPTDIEFSTTNASCYGMNDATATVTVTGGQTPYNYQWLPSNQMTQTATGLEVRSYTVLVQDANGCILTGDTAIYEPFQIVDSLKQAPTSCGGSDGSIEVYISGGVSPYSYAWDNGATSTLLTGLAEGILNLTVTDATACTEEFIYAINGSNAPSITLTSNDVLCYGSSDGSIVSNVIGGISPYTYTWYDSDMNTIGAASSLTNISVGTYVLQVEDATTPTGCSAFAQIDIEQPDSVQFGPSVGFNPTCYYSSDGTTTVVPVGGTLPYTFAWNGGTAGQTTASATGLGGGTFHLTVTDANGCMNADSVTIIAPDTVRIDTTAGTVFCDPSGGNLILSITGGTGTNYTYQWSNGRTTKDITGLNPGSYCITVTDEAGCTNTKCFGVGGPVIDVAVGIAASCNGEDGSAFIQVSGTNTPFTYTWNPFGFTGDNPSLPAGVYSVTVTDKEGCQSIADGITVTEPSAMSATFDTTSATCGVVPCNGAATANITGGTAPYDYQWGSGGTGSTEQNLCAGQHQVDVTDDNGCTASFFVGISNIGGADSVDYVVTSVTCNGNNNGATQLTQVYGGVSPYSYDWTGNPTGDGTSSVSNLTAGSIWVNISDQNNCLLVQEIVVDEPSAITDLPIIIHTKCNESNASIDNTISGGVSPYNYNWSNGSATNSISGLPTGIYKLTVTDNNNCTEVFTYNLNPSGTSVVTTSITDAICYGSASGEISVSVTNPNATSYTYVWSNGTTASSVVGVISATGLVAGEYIATITDNNGCIANAIETISQPDSMEVSSLALADISCNGLTDGSITLDYIGGTIPYSYDWGTSTGSSITNLPAGSYTVTVTDDNDCISIFTTSITEPEVLAIDTLNTVPSLCTQDSTGSVDLLVTGGSMPYDYTWSNGSTVQDPSGMPVGTYTVTVSDFRNCTETYTVEIKDSLSVVIGNLTDTAVCENILDVELRATAVVTPLGSILNFRWMEGTDTLSTVDTVVVSPVVGENQYTFIATYGGCTWDSTITVTVNTLPDVDAGEDIEMIMNGKREIGGDPTSVSATIFDWSPSIYLNDSTLANPEINPTIDGVFTYVVAATDANGCTSTDSLIITVIPKVEIVDIFTPNADGINDTWEIPFLDQYPDADVEIYNRWGELLYQISGGYTIPWDATYNGSPVPVGTYYYVITLNHPDADEPIVGPLSVVR